jgi:hypothetical protein
MEKKRQSRGVLRYLLGAPGALVWLFFAGAFLREAFFSPAPLEPVAFSDPRGQRLLSRPTCQGLALVDGPRIWRACTLMKLLGAREHWLVRFSLAEGRAA